MSTATSPRTDHHGQEKQRHPEAPYGNERTDRDSKGRFVKGNAGGPGNPFNRQVAALRQQLVDALTPERMGQVIEAVIQKAEAGDLAAAKLLWQYGMGKPAPAVQPDRMDVEELALYQEQQLAPEAWLQIIKSIPADMAVKMLRPLLPAIRRSAGKFVQQMAEESGIKVGRPAPSVTEDNGQPAPKANGDIGEREPNANGGNGEQAASGSGRDGREPLPNGGNGSQEGAARGISLVPARPTAGSKRKLTRSERRAEALGLRRLKAKWGLP